MKLFYCLMLLLCPYLSYSQNPNPGTGFIGYRMPDMAFTNILNYKTANASLSQFKAGLTIIDFWATWCSACLKKFPLLDSMQQQSNGQFRALLVNSTNTGDTKEKIVKLFSRLRGYNNEPLTLPVIYNDSILAAAFPHRLLPHYIWLNSNFTVFAITGSDELTAQNINAVLNGTNPSFPVKEGFGLFNRHKPLFVDANGGNAETLLQRSTLAGHISGLSAGTTYTKDPAGNITKILVSNTGIMGLLSQAYYNTLPKNRTLLSPPGLELPIERFTYELITPPLPLEQANRHFQQDLLRYFGLAATVKSQPTNCLRLSVDTSILCHFKTGPGAGQNNLYQLSGRQLINRPVNDLLVYLNQKLPLPVLSSTLPSFGINLSLPDQAGTDIKALSLALAPYGISLTQSQEILENFIIYKPSPKQ